MSNNSFITSTREMTSDKLKEMLYAVNSSRFENKLKITSDGFNDGGFDVYLNDTASIYIHVNEDHEIQMKHPLGTAELGNWIYSIYLNDLALIIDGLISDEGIEETWKGEVGKFSSLLNYITRTYSCIDEEKMREHLIEYNYKYVSDMRPDLIEIGK